MKSPSLPWEETLGFLVGDGSLAVKSARRGRCRGALVFFLLVAFLIVDEMAFTILLDLRAMLLVVRGGVGDGGCENICLEGELRQIPSTFGRSESGKDSWPVHSMCWGIMLPCAGS